MSPLRTPESTRYSEPSGQSRRLIVPGLGMNPFSGSSALIRHSTECPAKEMSSCRSSVRPVEAIVSCSATRSTPVTNSVTGCSTCRRVFISMNAASCRTGS